MGNGTPALSRTISSFNAATEEVLLHLKEKTGASADENTLRDAAEEAVDNAILEAKKLFLSDTESGEELHTKLLECFTIHGVQKETAKDLLQNQILDF